MNNGLLLAEVFYQEKSKNKQRKVSKNLRFFLLYNSSGSHLSILGKPSIDPDEPIRPVGRNFF